MKEKLLIALKVMAWLGGIVIVITMLNFAMRKQKQVECSNLNIDINEEQSFVLTSDVKRTIDKSNLDYLNKRLNNIRIDTLERKLKANPFVEDAQVFIDLKGNLKVEVEQRKPVVRVITGSGQQFYIDEQGFKMPLSYQYTSRVLVATGYVNELYTRVDTLHGTRAKDLYNLAVFIADKPFWAAQIDQVYVANNGDFELIPRVGTQRIVIGDASNLEKKFNGLMIFYKKALSKLGWSMYSTINVKYEGQIICTKSNSL